MEKFILPPESLAAIAFARGRGNYLNSKVSPLSTRKECIIDLHEQKKKGFARNDAKCNEGKKCAAFTRLVKHFRSDSSLVKLTQPLAQSSQTKFRSEAAHSYGFTLAETLITLTILGIVAALTVPNLVRRQVETSNRTKIKKAVGVYDSLMTKLTVQSNLKSNAAIQEWADDDCTNSSDLFKVVKFVSTNNKCKFKTADGVFWDITDIQKPIIALKEADLNDATAQSDTNRAFYMFAEYDGQGILRVTETAYDYTLDLSGVAANEVNASVDRLIAFMKGITTTQLNEIETDTSVTCDTDNCCSSHIGQRCKQSVAGCRSDQSLYSNCVNTDYYDENGKLLYSVSTFHNDRNSGIGGVGTDHTWIFGDDIQDRALIAYYTKSNGTTHYWDRACSRVFGVKNCVNEMDVDKNGNITSLHIVNGSNQDIYYSGSSIPFGISCTTVPCSLDGDTYTEKPSDTVPFESYHNYFNNR